MSLLHEPQLNEQLAAHGLSQQQHFPRVRGGVRLEGGDFGLQIHSSHLPLTSGIGNNEPLPRRQYFDRGALDERRSARERFK